MNNNEIWKIIPDMDNRYSISNLGRLKSNKRNKILTLNVNNRDYIRKNITIGQKQYNLIIHVLVAKMFVPNPDNKKYVKHKNNNRNINTAENLEWVNLKEKLDKSI